MATKLTEKGVVADHPRCEICWNWYGRERPSVGHRAAMGQKRVNRLPTKTKDGKEVTRSTPYLWPLCEEHMRTCEESDRRYKREANRKAREAGKKDIPWPLAERE